MVNDDHPLMCCCCQAAHQHIIEEKDAEIARLREAIRRLADQNATLSVCNGNVTVEMDATFTDAEREAVDEAVQILRDHDAGNETLYATLRGLLARLGGKK